MMKNSLEIYGVDFSSLPVLKEKEMNELIFRLQHGDYESRETFIKVNLRLLLSIIQRFNNQGENVDVLFQVGRNGLMKSIDNFDLSLDISFSTYVIPIIIKEIRKYLKDTTCIRLSISLRDIAYKALQVRDRLVREDNKEPTISKIAKELELPREEVVFALDSIKDPDSFFEPTYQIYEDSINEVDQESNTINSMDSWSKNISIKKSLGKLNNNENLVLNLRYALGRTQMEVADEIGISKEQVFRLEKSALKHMRNYV